MSASVLGSKAAFMAGSVDSGGRDPVDDFWYTALGLAGSAGMLVTQETAMRHATVWACVNAIAETLSALPLGTFRRLPNGDMEPIPQFPLHEILHDRPNDEHTAMEYREIMQSWALMRGTAVSEIVPGRRGAVDQLIPLHPNDWRPVKQIDASQRSRWVIEHAPTDAPRRILLRDEVFLLRARVMKRDSIEGVDPITQNRESISAALATQEYAGRFFANNMTPSGIIEHPQSFKDKEARNNFLRAWSSATTGSNRNKTAILEKGLKFHQISLTQEQAQYLETRQVQKIDICSIFRVPPHKVGILDEAKFKNIEQQAIEWVTDTIMPWAERWEQAIKRDLITLPDVVAEHNMLGLLRGDIAARYKAYSIGRNWGWLSANDVRRLENMNSIGPDGDHYLQPLNMIPAGDEDEEDEDRDEDEDERAPRALTIGMRKEGRLWIPPSTN